MKYSNKRKRLAMGRTRKEASFPVAPTKAVLPGDYAATLQYMRAFAVTWPDMAIVQAVLAQITWYHKNECLC